MQTLAAVWVAGASPDTLAGFVAQLQRLSDSWTQSGTDPVKLVPAKTITLSDENSKALESKIEKLGGKFRVRAWVTWVEATDAPEPSTPEEPSPTRGDGSTRPPPKPPPKPPRTPPERDLPMRVLARFVRRARAMGRVDVGGGQWIAAWLVGPRLAVICNRDGRPVALPSPAWIELGYDDPELKPTRLLILDQESPLDFGVAGRLVLTAAETDDGRRAGAFGWLDSDGVLDESPVWMWLAEDGTQLVHRGFRTPPDCAGAAVFDDRGRIVGLVDAGSGDRDRWAVPPLDRKVLTDWIRAKGGRGRGGVPLALRAAQDDEARGDLRVLVRLRNPDWLLPERFVLEARLGRLLLGRIPADTLDALASDPEVASLETSLPGLPTVIEGDRDTVLPLPTTLPFGMERVSRGGPRCLLIIVDTGINPVHPTLVGPDGRSRVIGIWDQGDEGKPPSDVFPGAPSYGRWYAPDEVGSFPNTAGNHGTAVTMAAAGRAMGAWPGGTAPGCPVVFIRWAEAGGQIGSSHGLVAALALASALHANPVLGRDAVVVNISLGTHGGGHDGSTLVEEAIDVFTEGGRARGKVVVKSAGNEGGEGRHALLTPPEAGPDLRVLRWTTPRDEGLARPADRIELWHDPRERFLLQLDVPGAPPLPLGRDEGAVDEVVEGAGGQVRVRMERFRLSPENGDTQIVILLSPVGTSRLPAGDWSLRLEGAGGAPVHAWIERPGDTERVTFAQSATSVELTVPGTARSVITVGASTGTFSSAGPTRDGRRKPEVSAPGVTAAPDALGGLAAVTGTSFAAPAIAGLIAAALSRTSDDGMPTAAQVRAALVLAAGSEWDPLRGHGEPDAVVFFAALGLDPTS